MKVLVVGGAGYVGSVLVEELVCQGYEVRVLDRMYFGDVGLQLVKDSIEVVVGDMRSFQPEVLDGIDAVINVGGLSNDPCSEYNPEANHQMNVVATLRLARECWNRGIERFIFASTCSIYDSGLSEGCDIVQDEYAIVKPEFAYSLSKYEAERGLLDMAVRKFCPVILRKGTIYGYSPRMRYDLVVNTFVAHALSKGYITVFNGGEMWRPLIDIRDVARAYIACIEADADKVRGQIFNISYKNYRISELALRVRQSLLEVGIDVGIKADYRDMPMRSYRVCTDKVRNTLGFVPEFPVELSVKCIVSKVAGGDFSHPRYYNIKWMKLLEETRSIIDVTGGVF